MKDHLKDKERELIDFLYKAQKELPSEQFKSLLQKHFPSQINEGKGSQGNLEHKNELLHAILTMQNDFLISGMSYGWCKKTLHKLLHLTNSEFGFIDELLTQDGGTPYLLSHITTNIAWDDESRRYYEEKKHTGLEFFNFNSIWGQVMKTGKAYISEDPDTDPHRGGYPKEKGHPALKKFLGIPIKGVDDELIGMMAVANNPNGYNQELVDFIEPFASTYGVLLEKNRLEKKHKQIEEALRESEAKYRELVENANSIILRYDLNGKITYFNEYAQRFFGYRQDEILGQDVMIIVPKMESTGHSLETLAQDIIETPGKFEENINQNICKNGETVWISWRNKAIKDSEGKVIGNLGVGQDITDRKQAEEALLETNDRFQSFIEQLPVAVGVWDLDGTCIHVNQKFINLIGFQSTEEIIGRPAFELFSAQFREDSKERTRRRLQGLPVPNEYEAFVLHKDGTEFPVHLAIAPIKLSDKTVSISFLTDLTERKQAEEALRESESFFSQIFEQSTISTCLYNPDGIIHSINNEFCKMFGVEEKVIINAGYNVFKDQANIDAGVIPLLREIFDEKKTKNWETIFDIDIASSSTKTPTSKKGKLHLAIFGYPILDDKGRLKYVVLQHYDISERKQAEKALKESEERSNLLLQATTEGLCFHDQGLVLHSNKRLVEIFGYDSLEEILALQINVIQFTAPESRELVRKNFTSGYSEPYEAMGLRKDGSTFPMMLHGRQIPFEGRTVRIASVRDLTEQKQAEEEKLKAQKIAEEHKKLALVGQIAGKMAHDFNNILGIIMGNTELSLMDCKDAGARKTFELIFEQTLRGKNLTRNLVAFARDQEPRQEFFMINEKIDLVFDLMKNDLEGIKITREYESSIPELLADPGMIEHAFVNLLQNSIHALSMVEHPRITVKAYSGDDRICLEIEDNGCGIPKEHLEAIYEPSFTLKGSKDVTGSYQSGINGTGYGMANIKKYVEQHKGSISVESELGSGTKFTICLPVIKKELTKEEKVELQEAITHFEKYILLVEDETGISNVQYRMLTEEPCNHKVDKADNGQVAMDLFDRNKYDFVSLDYVLPGGISGMDVYEHIRKTNKTIPILFISGNIEFLESIKELKQKDVYIDHLSKPCQNKDYVNGINELLEKNIS